MSTCLDLPPIKFQNARIVGEGVNPSDYHAEQVMRGMPGYVLTRSSLLAFASCPKKWINGWRPKDSDATEWGSLIDCLVLTPNDFPKRYAVAPSFYPAPKNCTAVKEGKCKEGDPIPWDNKASFCKQWTAQQEGVEVISKKKFNESQIALEAISVDPAANSVLANSAKQVWVEGEYYEQTTKLTVKVKTLIDIVPSVAGEFGRDLFDFKTTHSAHPATWNKSVYTFGYDAQAALCLDLFNATGGLRQTFRHIIQENIHPYQTARRIISEEFIQLGRLKIVSALDRYCACLKSNHWPDWDESGPLNFDGFTLVQPAPWMIGQIDTHVPESTDEKAEELSEMLN